MSGAVVYDSGALDRAATDPELRATVRALVEAGWVPIVPTVVLAEAISGGPTDAVTNRVVEQTGTVLSEEPITRLAGRLRAEVHRSGRRRRISGIDAIVAAHAADAAPATVLTTEPDDLGALLTDHPRVVVLGV